MKNFIRKNLLGIGLGIFALGTCIVIGDNLQASDIDYSTQNSSQYGATKDKVQGAIDELYTKGQTKLSRVQAQANSPTTTIYSMPRLIYLNPASPTTICKQSDLVASDVNNKTGCMKWYIYGETSDKYIAILDHNTTAKVSNWSSAPTQLTSDTSSWHSSITRRLITADEVAKITGADTALNFNPTSSSWFYLDGSYGSASNWQTQVANSSNKSRYAWLYDYTGSSSSSLCTTYGCNSNPNSSYYTVGYWTSTSKNASNAWFVYHTGSLYTYVVSYSNLGVRPVIEFSKSILLNRN